MPDHLIIDASRQPSQIRCLHCRFAQDLPLPMPINELVVLELAGPGVWVVRVARQGDW